MRQSPAAAGVILFGLLLTGAAPAEETPPEKEDPAHEELRELRRDLIERVEGADIDGMLNHLDPDAVVTFMDGRQARGRDQVRAYFERMLTGDDRVVESYRVDAEVAELTIFHEDDTGVAYGTATSHFNLSSGREFTVTGPWTATVVKENGEWRIAAFHSSANMFDNPILDIARRWIIIAAVAAGIAGLVLGIVIVLLMKRKRPA